VDRRRDLRPSAFLCGFLIPRGKARTKSAPWASSKERSKSAMCRLTVNSRRPGDKTLRRSAPAQVQAWQGDPATPRSATQSKRDFVAKNRVSRQNSPRLNSVSIVDARDWSFGDHLCRGTVWLRKSRGSTTQYEQTRCAAITPHMGELCRQKCTLATELWRQKSLTP
jgi:hypothetical protein